MTSNTLIALAPTSAGIALGFAAISLTAYVIHDIRDYRRFKSIDDTEGRQRSYRKWIAIAFALYALTSLLLLALFGRLDAIWRLPPEFPANLPHEFARIAGAGAQGVGAGALAARLFGAITAGGLAGIVVFRALRRLKGSVRIVGDIQPLLPRNTPELGWAAALSFNAGVSEELFFRLLLPLLITTLTGNALIGFGAASIIFGLTHAYQGVWGVVATSVAGLVLSYLYLWTGSLPLMIGVHILIDLRALVLGPAVDLWLKRARRNGPHAA